MGRPKNKDDSDEKEALDRLDFRHNKNMTLKFTSSEYRSIGRAAKSFGETKSGLVRRVIRQWLESGRDKDAPKARRSIKVKKPVMRTKAKLPEVPAPELRDHVCPDEAAPVGIDATKPAAPDLGLGPAAARCAYTLVDVEVRSIVYESFEIPDTVERASLVPGDMAKLVFEAEGAGGHMAAAGGHMAGERMWVKIDSVDIATGRYMGVLSNQPVSSKELGLKMGDLVVFEPKHVAGIARSDVLMMGGGGSDSVDEPIKN